MEKNPVETDFESYKGQLDSLFSLTFNCLYKHMDIYKSEHATLTTGTLY